MLSAAAEDVRHVRSIAMIVLLHAILAADA